MKLLSLNVWGGRLFRPLIAFVGEMSSDVDIFCFQEVYHTPSRRKVSNRQRVNLLHELGRTLRGFRAFFAPVQDGTDFRRMVGFPLSFGKAILVREELKVRGEGTVFVLRERNAQRGMDYSTMGTAVQYLSFRRGGSDYTICNFHGLATHGPKVDTPERIEQSQRLKAFLRTLRTPKVVLCGDFNLLPDTRSLAIVGKGMRNLIAEHGITSTRSNHFNRAFSRFADYAFVTPAVEVLSFRVLPDEVSDHLPLLLDFR